MIRFIRPMRAPEDDYAPVDYTFVPSVSEGRRLEQMKKIHREEAQSGPIVRHRAEPEDSDLPEYRVHPVGRTASTATARDTVMRRLPSMADGPAPAQRAAYPPGYHHEDKEDYGLPDNPFTPPAETQQRRRRSRTGEGERTAMPSEKPAQQEMPEWLRVAQQNNMPLERPGEPRMQTPAHQMEAPEVDALGRPLHRRQAPVLSPYEQAGYPEELVQAQKDWEAQQAMQPLRRRHGAQYAVNPHRAERAAGSSLQAHKQERLAWQREANGEEQASFSSPPQRGAVPQGLRGDSSYEQQMARQEATPPSAYADAYASQPASEISAVRRTAPLRRGGEDRVAPDGSIYAPPVHMQYREPEPVMRRKAPVQQEAPDDGWHVENDEEREPIELPAWLTRVPWLGIGAFVSVLAAVILWIMGSNYEKDIQLVLAARQAQQIAIEEKHPLKYEGLIDEKAYKYNLSPAFVAAIMLNESSFRPDATASSTGAKGLMQLVDDTSEWVHGKLNWPEPYNPQDLYDPEINAEFGCWYLNYLSNEFRGDPVLVAAAYHAGQNNVQNWLNTSSYSPDGRTLSIDKIPFDDTRRYVTRVINNFAAYKRLYYGG